MLAKRQGNGGKEAYQHPDRPGQKMSPDIDNFSAWVILLALRGLAADLSLWARHVRTKDDEKERPLLFTAANHVKPRSAEAAPDALWADLFHSPDSEVGEWAKQLFKCLAQSFAVIPMPSTAAAEDRSSGTSVASNELEASAKHGPQLVELWDRLKPSLAGIEKAQPYCRLAALYKAVAMSQPSEEAILTAWDELQAVGGHPGSRSLP